MTDAWASRWADAWTAGAQRFNAAEAQRVGPHGYVHGWIYVGGGGLAKGHGLKAGDRIKGHHSVYGDFEGHVTKVHQNGNLIATVHQSKLHGGKELTGIAVNRRDVTHVGKESSPHLGSVEHVGRFNQFHAPAGSPIGGEFTTSGGGGSGAKGGKASAHQAHVAHVQHVQQQSRQRAARAQRKAALLKQAHADRVKAAQLTVQLKALQHQAAQAAKTAAHAKAAAAQAHVNPAKSAAAKKAAQHRHAAHATATAKKHASLKSRIATLQTQIKGLLAQAHADEAAAAKL